MRVEAAKGEARGGGPKASSAKGGSRVVALVGAMPTLARGRRVRVEGEWVMDKRFGAQLKARSMSLSVLQRGQTECRALGVFRWLGSRRSRR